MSTIQAHSREWMVNFEADSEEYSEKHETNTFVAIILRRDAGWQFLGGCRRFHESD
jgi:hypothetical protein